MVHCLPSMHEVLGSEPNCKISMLAYAYDPVIPAIVD